MQSFRFRTLTFATLLCAGALTAAAQSPTNIDWENLSPEKEVFSVQMPKGSTFETGKEPYHKLELNTRYYISKSPTGAVFAIASFSGIPPNPAQYSEMQRLNSYVDAFKQLFPPKLKGKETIAKITLVGDKKLQGNLGREYRMTIGALQGTANVYATRKRFYAIVFLDSKRNDELQDKFLSSFLLPENIPTPVVAAEIAPGDGAPPKVANIATKDPDSAPPANGAEKGEDTEAKLPESKTAGTAPGVDGKKRGPISGGVLNGKALSLPAPDYPFEARSSGAQGTVTVQVTIDEAGNVIAANAVAGHPMLQSAAVNAARLARFSPTMLLGEPVKVTGVITYNFVMPQN